MSESFRLVDVGLSNPDGGISLFAMVEGLSRKNERHPEVDDDAVARPVAARASPPPVPAHEEARPSGELVLISSAPLEAASLADAEPSTAASPAAPRVRPFNPKQLHRVTKRRHARQLLGPGARRGACARPQTVQYASRQKHANKRPRADTGRFLTKDELAAQGYVRDAETGAWSIPSPPAGRDGGPEAPTPGDE